VASRKRRQEVFQKLGDGRAHASSFRVASFRLAPVSRERERTTPLPARRPPLSFKLFAALGDTQRCALGLRFRTCALTRVSPFCSRARSRTHARTAGQHLDIKVL